MSGPSGRQQLLFTERRQAHGWLVAHLSSAAIGTVTWAYLAAIVLGIWPDAPVVPAVFALLAIGLLGALLWGRRVSGGSPPAPSRGAGDGRPRRLRRERLLAEEAARQVGWSPALVVWIYRVLMAVGVGLMVLTVVVWLSQLG